MVRHLPVFLLLAACHGHHVDGAGASDALGVEGPDSTGIDLLRAWPGDAKVYVQADIGLEDPALFMVDTGASVSTVTREAVEELGLGVDEKAGMLQGLGGMATWDAASLPEVRLGDMIVHDVHVAVDVQGVPAWAGTMPLTGILGNNVWARFRMEIDYPTDRMRLVRAGLEEPPEGAQPLLFDGMHCYSLVDIRAEAEEGEPPRSSVLLAVDTGAHGLLLSGEAGLPFRAQAVEGEEPIYGIGGGDDLPASSFMRTTRRIPLAGISLGGLEVEGPEYAQWINFGQADLVGPEGLPGLVGYAAMSEHRLVLDFQAGRIALVPSQGEPRERDGHEVLLAQDRDRHGDDPERGLLRARWLAWLERYDEAVQVLEPYLDLHPDDVEAHVTLARLQRLRGDLDAAWEALAGISTSDLIDEGALVPVVNAHLLESRPERAEHVARAAVEAREDEPSAWLALADVLAETGHLAEAREALATTNRLAENPDGHLLRRARIAELEGDVTAALTHLRRLLQLHPLGGFSIWFYTQLAETPEQVEGLRVDLERAMARLYPEDRPLDFALAARRHMGDSAEVERLLERGLERDCVKLDKAPARQNCEAWYLALAEQDLDRALELSEAANEARPNRSDYLDTLALVQWKRGALEEAWQHQLRAARLTPGEIYLTWELGRLERQWKGEAPPPSTDEAGG